MSDYCEFSFPIKVQLDQQIRMIAEIFLHEFNVNECKKFKNTSLYGFSLESLDGVKGVFISFKYIKFFGFSPNESAEYMNAIHAWLDREVLSMECQNNKNEVIGGNQND